MAGPGQISVISQSSTHMTALLYNFDVNSSVLKSEHHQWLKRNVPQFSGRNMKATMVGLASRTGSDQLNWNLSKRRADSVSRVVFSILIRLDDYEFKVAVGEEAARAAGVKDRVEDAKWRAVLLNLYDPRNPPPTARQTPAKVIWRRTYKGLEISSKPGKAVPMDPQDKKAEKIFQASTKLMRRYGGDVVLDERAEWMPETHMIKSVAFTKREEKSSAWESVELEVVYQWGPPDGQQPLLIDTNAHKGWRISADYADAWLDHATSTFLRM